MVNTPNNNGRYVTPQFVDAIPVDSDLEDKVLYISLRYNTLVHRCPCGCGGLSEIGLHPATRRLIYDGKSISIEPSIGVQTLPCRSHYWITKNRIIWAEPLSNTEAEIAEQNRRKLSESYEQINTGRSRLKLEIWTTLRSQLRKWFT